MSKDPQEETVKELFSGSLEEVETTAAALAAEAEGTANLAGLRRTRSRALDLHVATNALISKLERSEGLV